MTTYGDIETQARDAAARALTGGEAAAARAAIAEADRAMAHLAEVPEVAEAVAGAACAAGCGWCCHQVVGITTAEEMMVAQAVDGLPQQERARIARKVAAAQCKLSNLPREEWQAARIPCPALDDEGRCAIHAARPLPCRAVLSADATACRAWHDGEDGARIPLVAAQRRVYASAQAGLAQALAMNGIPPGPVSLVEALALALG